MTLKEKLKRLALKNPAFNIIYRVSAKCNSFRLILTSARARSEFFTRRKYKENHFQKSTYTVKNRSPLVFEECEKYLQAILYPKLLSFGCSTGEEAFTLAEYMPDAIIRGVDINKWCIKKCIRKNRSEKLHFYHRLSEEFNTDSGFDAIFCIAVFQRDENRVFDQITSGFTFQQFEKEITLLDTKLKPGGLFIIHHSNFNFADTKIADHYTPLPFKGNKKLLQRPLFDQNNSKISDITECYRVFVKQLPD
ncbi:MAG: methyltransferase domain-containing protein [Bacteroidetes bacterium]|jgi:cyclopropane fatty-acyl-phospholipid synthase-like methyltransferase|nr:methyltransferase domain-containing protein [Bacteroidota bacterium]